MGLLFLSISVGDVVVVAKEASFPGLTYSQYWLGFVICVFCSARDPSVNSLFQIVDIATGFVKTVNADLVLGVLVRQRA